MQNRIQNEHQKKKIKKLQKRLTLFCGCGNLSTVTDEVYIDRRESNHD